MYVSNPRNFFFDYFPFYGDQRLISGQLIYCANDDIIERLNNGLVIDTYRNIM